MSRENQTDHQSRCIAQQEAGAPELLPTRTVNKNHRLKPVAPGKHDAIGTDQIVGEYE